MAGSRGAFPTKISRNFQSWVVFYLELKGSCAPWLSGLLLHPRSYKSMMHYGSVSSPEADTRRPKGQRCIVFIIIIIQITWLHLVDSRCLTVCLNFLPCSEDHCSFFASQNDARIPFNTHIFTQKAPGPLKRKVLCRRKSSTKNTFRPCFLQ